MPRHLLRTCIWGAACVSWAALALHPHAPRAQPHADPHGSLPPNFLPTMPVVPEPFPLHPDNNIGHLMEAPSIGRNYEIEKPPLLPAHLSRQAPSPADLKRIVVEHVRQQKAYKAYEGEEITVEIKKGGYLVTRIYRDPDFKCCIWEITFFVPDREIADKIPKPRETETGTTRPPGLPPSGAEQLTRPDPNQIKLDKPLKPDPIAVKPGDKEDDKKSRPRETETGTTRPPGLPPSGAEQLTRPDPNRIKFDEPLKLDPIAVKPGGITEFPGGITEFDLRDPLALEKKLRELSFEGTVIRDEFSPETQAAIMEAMAVAGKISLEAGLIVASTLPVAGTVITAARTFDEQYWKTYSTLLKNGVLPPIANQEALVQATVVAGVAVGVDLATGSVVDKLKPIIRNPLLERIRRYKDWGEDAKTMARVERNIDRGIDVTAPYLLTAGGKAIIGVVTAEGEEGETIKNAGGSKRPPPIPIPYGAVHNGGLLFLER